MKYRLVGLGIAVALWQVASQASGINPALAPSPFQVLTAFVEYGLSGELLEDVWASLGRVIVGYGVGAIVGLVAGVITSVFVRVGAGLSGILMLLRSFPPIAVVPLAVIWLGIGETSKYALVAFGVFFPVWMSAHHGFSQVDRGYIWLARSMGASKARQVLRVLLPAAWPPIHSGLRVALSISFYCLIAAELAGAFSGIAYRIELSHLAIRVDKMLAALVVLGVTSWGLDALFVKASHFLWPWLRVNHD